MRTILHVDMDAFYASVEQRDRPELRGRPVIVGGSERRGVVCAASYEARPSGVRSAMPMARAVALCPQAVVLRPRMSHYAEVSARIFAVLERYSPLVEALSLDEAFLDVTGEERLLGDGATIGARIKAELREAVGLVASVGVAPVKLVAKIASDVCKPDGLCVVPPDGARAFLEPLPVSRLWGVGEVTGKQLLEGGYRTIGDLARAGRAALASRVGAEAAERLTALARGEDDREVVPDREAVSIGAEETFDTDVRDRAQLVVALLEQTDRVCARARDAGQRARVVTIKIKYADFRLLTRRTTLPIATSDGRLVGKTAERLLAEVPDIERRGVRLTGVSLSGLEAEGTPRQLGFDDRDAVRGEALGHALDGVRARFGAGALRRAVHINKPDGPEGS